MSKVLMPIGSAAEVMDTLYAYYRIKEAGFEAVVAGPEAQVYQMVLHEIAPGWDITRETPGYHLAAEIAFRDVVPEEYDGLFLTGGRAPEYIRDDQDLIRAVRHFFEAGKPVCSVCHGAELPAAAGVLRGRRMATVAKCRLDVELSHGVYVNEGVVEDGNLVSGRTWHDQHLYMPAFVKMLQEQAGRKGVSAVAAD
jgi:deglycase